MIRGLDSDEVEFLEFVDRTKIEAEKKQREEERKLLQELKNRPSVIVNTKELLEAELNGIRSKPKVPNGPARPSQKSLLAGIVKKRPSSDAVGEELATKKAKGS